MKKNRNILNTKWFFNRVYFIKTKENNLSFFQIISTYKKDIFSWKNIILKVSMFLICCVILIPISLHLQNWALSLSVSDIKNLNDTNSIIGVQPIGNPGIEFSFLSSTPVWVVYFMESITIILASICLIFIMAKPWYVIPLSFCLIGGIMNANSRASLHDYVEGSYYYYQYLNSGDKAQYANRNVVIDYWYFKTGNRYSIFNFNDTCVISGAIAFILSILIFWIYLFIIPYNKEKRPNDLKYENIKNNI